MSLIAGPSYDNPDAEGFSVHSSELPAFFTFANSSLPLFTAMRQYFTSFATGGVPVATLDDPSNNATWEVGSGSINDIFVLLVQGSRCFRLAGQYDDGNVQNIIPS